jgi:hypothetical protein
VKGFPHEIDNHDRSVAFADRRGRRAEARRLYHQRPPYLSATALDALRMNAPDGLEERTAVQEEWAESAWERIEHNETRADELRDALIDIMTPVAL